MKRKLITEIAGYAYATIDLYAATHSEFHRGQMLAYINTLEAVGGSVAKQLQGELKNAYNDWTDALNMEPEAEDYKICSNCKHEYLQLTQEPCDSCVGEEYPGWEPKEAAQ